MLSKGSAARTPGNTGLLCALIPDGRRQTLFPVPSRRTGWVSRLDVDYELFGKLQDTHRVCAYVHGLMSGVSARFEGAVPLKLSALHIWKKPYEPQQKCWDEEQEESWKCMLERLREYWIEKGRDDFPGDITHILSGYKDLGGGRSYLQGYFQTLCDPDRSYGLSSLISTDWGPNLVGPPFPIGYVWAFAVVTHALGHRIGSPHTQCYDPPIDRCACCSECKGRLESQCDKCKLVYTHGTVMSDCYRHGGGSSLRFDENVKKLLQKRVEEWREAQSADCHDRDIGGP